MFCENKYTFKTHMGEWLNKFKFKITLSVSKFNFQKKVRLIKPLPDVQHIKSSH